MSTSIIAIEAALRERYGGTNLALMIEQALADGSITDAQVDHLNTGRAIRNRYAHGKMMHPAIPIAVVATLVKVSLDVIAVVSASP